MRAPNTVAARLRETEKKKEGENQQEAEFWYHLRGNSKTKPKNIETVGRSKVRGVVNTNQRAKSRGGERVKTREGSNSTSG